MEMKEIDFYMYFKELEEPVHFKNKMKFFEIEKGEKIIVTIPTDKISNNISEEIKEDLYNSFLTFKGYKIFLSSDLISSKKNLFSNMKIDIDSFDIIELEVMFSLNSNQY